MGGILGGAVLFAWGALSHMVLGLGEAGIRPLPNEAALTTAMQDGIEQPGFYFFPAPQDETADMSDAERKQAMDEWVEKYKQGPWGILIYHPTGEDPMSPRRFAIQFASGALAALLAAFLLSQAGGSLTFANRVCFVAVLGVFVGLVANVPYWNWYGFPPDHTLAAIADHAAGWGPAGLVLAAIVKSPK